MAVKTNISKTLGKKNQLDSLGQETQRSRVMPTWKQTVTDGVKSITGTKEKIR